MAKHAVAVDLGASSVRFAEGCLQNGRIEFRVVHQVPNEPIETDWGPAWNMETLLSICREAESFAKSVPGATLGIDSWGVDQGFIDGGGNLIQPPACYRHPLHAEIFEELRELRPRLYALTGIQHQPFNTFYQLIARRRQRPELMDSGARWLILPELMAHLLGALAGHEITQASTTQLLGLDGKWSTEACALAGWPLPDSEPKNPGVMAGMTKEGVPIARVGAHDTASAVCGLGSLSGNQAFLNAGTWSLLGVILEKPIATPAAETANLTNERGADGKIRFLDNIPGFFVINRLHDELGISETVSEWLTSANLKASSRLDLFDHSLFSPASMVEAARRQISSEPNSNDEWAGIALLSLVDATIQKLNDIEKLTGRKFTEIRISGGGSASEAFCSLLAHRSGRSVIAGPQEATVLGNLGVQFLAQGAISSFEEMGSVIAASIELRRYEP